MKFAFIDTAHATVLPEAQTSASADRETGAMTHEAASTDTGILASLGINLSLFVFQLINFLIVASIIWFIILKPLTKKMAERQKLIDESLANAQKIQEKMAKSERDYQGRIDTAKVDANKIIEKATAEAVALGASLKDKAHQDIELLVDQAKRNIEIERDRTIQLIKKNAADFVIAAVEKVLSEKLDGPKDQKLVAEMVSKITYAEEK